MKKKWVQMKGGFRENMVVFLGVMMFFCVAEAVQAADSRFQEVEGSNGSILRDNNTGLEWQRCPHGQSWTGSGCSGRSWLGSWHKALQVTASGGFQLPTIKELHTLNPIDQNVFPGGGWFWSSSPYVGDSNAAWGLNFDGGYVGTRSKDRNGQVRLVRAGQ